MKPDIAEVLIELSALVARNAAPDIPPADRAGALGLTAALLAIAGRQWDEAAHNLALENRSIRSLLTIPGEDLDIRISTLSAENARLRALLIERHVEVEGRDSRAEAEIWAELVASTARRLAPGSPV